MELKFLKNAKVALLIYVKTVIINILFQNAVFGDIETWHFEFMSIVSCNFYSVKFKCTREVNTLCARNGIEKNVVFT